MTWAQRLKRVFGIDIETCAQCDGMVKVIASIEDPVVIEKILSHLNKKNSKIDRERLPESSQVIDKKSLNFDGTST